MTDTDLWFLRQHPVVLNLQFKTGVSRTEKDVSIDQFLGNNSSLEEMKYWSDIFYDEANESLSMIGVGS